jgi:SAM-dependent methyltransferase
LASFFAGSGEEHPIIATAIHAAASALRIAIQYPMVKSKEMAAYDDFAWFYDRYWADEFQTVAIPVLDRIWTPRLPAAAHLLDLCCGTGHLAAILARRGFRVTGLDASTAMIECARRNAPDAFFHVTDVADFQLPGQFDGAVSTFDSLNHILGCAAFEAVLRNTAAALKPGAPFAFDILFEEAYKTHWGENFAIVRDDHVLTITGCRFDPRRRRARCTITMFRRIDGVWSRSDVTVEEQCYKPEWLDAALRRAGFGEIACYDARDLGMAGDLGEGRTFYVAVRT